MCPHVMAGHLPCTELEAECLMPIEELKGTMACLPGTFCLTMFKQTRAVTGMLVNETHATLPQVVFLHKHALELPGSKEARASVSPSLQRLCTCTRESYHFFFALVLSTKLSAVSGCGIRGVYKGIKEPIQVPGKQAVTAKDGSCPRG